MSELENKRKERTVIRRLFTKSANELEPIVTRQDARLNLLDINVQYNKVRELYENLRQLDKTIKESLLENLDEEELQKELESQLDYKTKWLRIDAMYNELNRNTETKNTTTPVCNLKLPKLSLQLFDGDLRNWLPFFSQFEKIDRDTTLDKIDKYQYLLQSMKDNTEVKNLVESFPATAYENCMKELKQRYAREDLLIQIYIREILALVLSEQKESATQLYDKLNAQLRALETLNVTSEKYAAFLLPMVESSLPRELLRVWERQKQPTKDVAEELTNVLDFLRREVEGEQRIEMTRKTFKKTDISSHTEKEESQPFTAECLLTNVKEKKPSCIWCDKDSHASIECYKLPNMSQDQRKTHLKKKKACMICLRPGHHAKVCKTHIKCLMCNRRHNVVFCNSNSKPENNTNGASINLDQANSIQDTSPASSDQIISTPSPEPSRPTALSSAQPPTGGSGNTLLQTAVVNIRHGNNIMKVRALFDNGAQRSYIREDVALKMDIPAVGRETLAHSLFGGVEISSKEHKIYNIQVESLDSSFNFEITALGQPCICKNIPRYTGCNKTLTDKLRQHNIILQDTNENLKDTNIGILIGADFSGLLMTGIVIKIEDSLVAIKTKVGWTLQGKFNKSIPTPQNFNLFCASESITNFWSLDTLGIRDPAETEAGVQTEEDMMSWYQENTKVNKEGRYEVCLPYKVGHDDLLSNKDLATRRLESVTKRLISTSTCDDYDKVFREWQDLKIIEPVPDSEEAHRPAHYLPHRPVIKESSLTTRIRPVFDASAKDKQGKSLNASLEKGVNFLDKIPKLLTGFRKGQIGVTADIAKAFLQISVAPQERDMLRFLWWENGELKSFRHCRLVFGLTSSPFLLSATIMSHLNSVTGDMEGTAQLLSQSFYVDNCITSLNTEKAVHKFEEEAKVIMSQAKFDLRQWVVAPIQEKKQEGVIPVLGLEWHLDNDQMACNLSSIPLQCELGKVTKRILLSLTQKVFDPIGFTCPVTLVPKLILQEAWQRKLTWDEELPADLKDKFLNWYDSIFCLRDCKVPRRLSDFNINECTLQLHMLCDASKDGYAACVFLRAERDGKITVRLIIAKSRVVPPSKICIPRLELLAALIGTRLLVEARKDLNLSCQEYCWTDSSVTLCWIKRELLWNTFVGNRVREIREKTNVNDWYHIPGTLNWADVASRGCNAGQLLTSRWWEGPSWLLLPAGEWPQSQLIVDETEVVRELKKTACINVCHTEGMTDKLLYFSRYSKIIRTVAWILRFIKNSKKETQKSTGELSCEECDKAEKSIIYLIQRETKMDIEKRIGNLTHFYDKESILRVKTRLILTDVPESTKCPAVIPAASPIVRRIVEQRHVQLQHAGTNLLIADIRCKFWIIGLRHLVKSVISNCTICKRYKAKPVQAPTALLPVARTFCSAPFETTGVDLAGPLLLKTGEKCWVVLFTCAVYRAVHLELTNSLSTEAFLMTLRRFIARRGRVTLMISDNGTNFTGAHNLLSTIDWDKVIAQSNINRIKWRFNAPTAAWWGGFWERLIRILKDLLKRVLGKSSVGYEEMVTLLCDCEATMNARPLTYIEDARTSCLEPLMPSHFLQPLVQSEVTDLDAIDATSLNKRLRYLQKLREDFRQRFKSEYLTALVQRGKEKEDHQLKVGDIVLIETEEKRVKWPLGMITELFAGPDAVARTAKVKTSFGFKVRPVQRLYRLEIAKSDAEDLPQPTHCKAGTEVLRQTNTKVSKAVIIQQPTVSPKTTTRGRLVRLPSRYVL